MSARKDRRREQEAYLDPAGGNQRPVEIIESIKESERCPGRASGHNFSMGTRGPEGFSDERGSRVMRCWYCSRLSPFSQQRIDAWAKRSGASA
jgi:hypothetical protein